MLVVVHPLGQPEVLAVERGRASRSLTVSATWSSTYSQPVCLNFRYSTAQMMSTTATTSG